MWKRGSHPDLADVNVYTARRLGDMAQSLELLAKSCEGDKEIDGRLTQEDAEAALQMTAAVTCGGCARCRILGETQMERTYYLGYLLRVFEQNGRLEMADMPLLFQEVCRKREEYLAQLNRCLGRAAMNLEWKNRFLESRDTVMTQFRELSVLLEEFAHQMERATDITATKGNVVKRAFRSHSMIVENLLLLEYEEERREAYLTVRTEGGRCVVAKDAAEILGRAMGRRSWYVPRDTRTLITRRTATVRFVECGNYRVVYGVAGIPKEGETESGDNYMYSGNIPGQAVMSLFDGMGSGARAGAESRRVTELTQQLLEAGFCARSALKMVNTILLMSGTQQHPVTVDLACVDLHTGVLEAMKMGAAASFVRGDGGVEILEAGQAPAGVVNPAEPVLLTRKLWDGEMVIMVTDGVLEACPGINKEEILREYIEAMPVKGPQDMAEGLLQFVREQGDSIRDDMTVLAAGIWKNRKN